MALAAELSRVLGPLPKAPLGEEVHPLRSVQSRPAGAGQPAARALTFCSRWTNQPRPAVPLPIISGRMGGPRGLVKKGGLLLVSSTYCWSERTAASQLWLGGTTDAAGNLVR